MILMVSIHDNYSARWGPRPEAVARVGGGGHWLRATFSPRHRRTPSLCNFPLRNFRLRNFSHSAHPLHRHPRTSTVMSFFSPSLWYHLLALWHHSHSLPRAAGTPLLTSLRTLELEPTLFIYSRLLKMARIEPKYSIIIFM